MSRHSRYRASSRDFRHHARRALQTGLSAPASTSSMVWPLQMNIKGLLFRCCGPAPAFAAIACWLTIGGRLACWGVSERVRQLQRRRYPREAVICRPRQGALFSRGCHSADAFANCALCFVRVGDASDAGVHGTLPVTRAVHYKGNQVIAAAGDSACQQDIPRVFAQSGRKDRRRLKLHVQKRRRFAHDFVGDGQPSKLRPSEIHRRRGFTPRSRVIMVSPLRTATQVAPSVESKVARASSTSSVLTATSFGFSSSMQTPSAVRKTSCKAYHDGAREPLVASTSQKSRSTMTALLNSPIKTCVVITDEEMRIARETDNLVS